jgi:predicted DCC family thiol-disulfide oxidoreductase YuxK
MKDKVYYDENCYVCSFEINTIRERGERCGIEFVDINSPDFKEAGDYDTEMVGEFEGRKTVGIETFRLMYDKMGFTRAVWVSRLPIVKHLLNGGYWVFAHLIRPYLPRKNED